MNQHKKITLLTVLISLNFLILGFLGGTFYQSKKNEDEIDRLEYQVEEMLPRELPPGDKPWEGLRDRKEIDRLLNATAISGTVVRKNDVGVLLKTRVALVGVDTTNVKDSDDIEDGDQVVFTGKFNKSSKTPFFEAEKMKIT